MGSCSAERTNPMRHGIFGSLSLLLVSAAALAQPAPEFRPAVGYYYPTAPAPYYPPARMMAPPMYYPNPAAYMQPMYQPHVAYRPPMYYPAAVLPAQHAQPMPGTL